MFSITPGQPPTSLIAEANSIVLGGDSADILIDRFGGCGPDSPDDGVYRIAPDGTTTRIPTPDATEFALAW